MDVIYLDHNASAPLPQELLEEIARLHALGVASPSSNHRLGRESRRLINESTSLVANYLNSSPEAIVWTSGASEANSWIFHSTFKTVTEKGRAPRLIVSSIEHESVLASSSALQAQGAHVEYLRVHGTGEVDVQHLAALLDHARESGQPWDLVSVMHANNETGVVQPMSEVSKLCATHGVPLHSDCVQALGRVTLDASAFPAGYLTFSGHKLGAPKGIGFLVQTRKAPRLAPFVHGKQQQKLRGGTENAAAVGMVGRVVGLIADSAGQTVDTLTQLRNRFESELKRRIPGTIIHGEGAKHRLANTTFAGFEGVDGNGIVLSLDLEGICASSGSACSSGAMEPSHVLAAMGCDEKIARSSVRFSSGRQSEWTDFERVLEALPRIVERVRRQSRG